MVRSYSLDDHAVDLVAQFDVREPVGAAGREPHLGLRHHPAPCSKARSERTATSRTTRGGALANLAAVAADPCLERAADAVPARQHHAATGSTTSPAGSSTDGQRRLIGFPAEQQGTDIEFTDLRHRRRLPEVLDEPRCLVHERAVGSAGARAGRRDLVCPFRIVAQTLDVEQRGLQGRRDERLEVAPGTVRFGVLGGDDLALFGESGRTTSR